MLNEKKVYDVLAKIESMNETWSTELTEEQDKQHSFGRIRTQNNILKLWSVGHQTGQLLKFLVIASQAKTILELGCSSGYSALWLSLGAAITGGYVHTTEIFDRKIALAKQHFKEAGVENCIHLHEGEITSTLKNWQSGLIDFVLMDADISNYVTYFDYLLPLLSPHAIIVVDNADTHETYLKDFYKAVLETKQFSIDKLSVDHGLYLIAKRMSKNG